MEPPRQVVVHVDVPPVDVTPIVRAVREVLRAAPVRPVPCPTASGGWGAGCRASTITEMTCPKCGNDDPRLLERIGWAWFCVVCSWSWRA